MTSTRRVRGARLAAVLAVLAMLGGVVVTAAPDCPEGCQTLAAGPIPQSAPRPSPIEPAALSIVPSASAEDVNPAGPVRVTAATGTISNVTMVNETGKETPGA